MNDPEAADSRTPETAVDAPDPVSEDRREALKKMGKYAAYTAPAILALLAMEENVFGY